MTLLAIGSIFLTLLGLVTGWLQSQGSIYGWYLALISQVFWGAYALTTHQWGFVFGVVTGVVIAANGIRNWRTKQLVSTT
jgi:ABC-type antimicrobial peptide transport system permease subunit